MATYTEIHIRRDSTLNWYASNPRLALGEPGVDMTLRRFKIGNGIDRWNDLPYMNDDLYKQQDKTTQEIADKVQMLLNKIAANKVDADTKIESLSSDFRTTRREVTSRMDAVEEEQATYEEGLTARQTAYENKLTARQNGYEANLTAEFEGTKAEEELEMLKGLRMKLEADSEALHSRLDSAWEILRGGTDGR